LGIHEAEHILNLRQPFSSLKNRVKNFTDNQYVVKVREKINGFFLVYYYFYSYLRAPLFRLPEKGRGIAR
jgi:hypothetical protein